MGEEGPEVLRLQGQQLVGLAVEVHLQLLYLSQVGLVVVHVDFSHHLSVVVANLGVDLPIEINTWGFWSLKNSVKTLYLARTFFCTIWILVLGFLRRATWSRRNSRSLTEALALSFSSSGCSSLTALESGAMELWLR